MHHRFLACNTIYVFVLQRSSNFVCVRITLGNLLQIQLPTQIPSSSPRISGTLTSVKCTLKGTLCIFLAQTFSSLGIPLDCFLHHLSYYYSVGKPNGEVCCDSGSRAGQSRIMIDLYVIFRESKHL